MDKSQLSNATHELIVDGYTIAGTEGTNKAASEAFLAQLSGSRAAKVQSYLRDLAPSRETPITRYLSAFGIQSWMAFTRGTGFCDRASSAVITAKQPGSVVTQGIP